MTRFKVGDKVRVKNDLEAEKRYNSGCLFVIGMEKYKGTIYEVVRIREKGDYDDERYGLEGCGGWAFSNDMLESIHTIDENEMVFSRIEHKKIMGEFPGYDWFILCDGMTKEEMENAGYNFMPSCAVKRKYWQPYKEDTTQTKDFIEDKKKEEKNMEKVLEIYKKRAIKAIKEEKEKEIKKELETNDAIIEFKKVEELYKKEMVSLMETYNTEELECICKDEYSSSMFYLNDYYIDSITDSIKDKYTKKEQEVYDFLEEVQARIDLVKSTSNDYKEIEKILTDYEVFEKTKSPFTNTKTVKKNKKD